MKLNPNNIKAWYRSARACLALDKISEANDSIARGLMIDKDNKALITLLETVNRRTDQIRQEETGRLERLQAKMLQEKAMKTALKVSATKKISIIVVYFKLIVGNI